MLSMPAEIFQGSIGFHKSQLSITFFSQQDRFKHIEEYKGTLRVELHTSQQNAAECNIGSKSIGNQSAPFGLLQSVPICPKSSDERMNLKG